MDMMTIYEAAPMSVRHQKDFPLPFFCPLDFFFSVGTMTIVDGRSADL